MPETAFHLFGYEAFRWTADEGITALVGPSCMGLWRGALAVPSDGSVVVGSWDNEEFSDDSKVFFLGQCLLQLANVLVKLLHDCTRRHEEGDSAAAWANPSTA